MIVERRAWIFDENSNQLKPTIWTNNNKKKG